MINFIVAAKFTAIAVAIISNAFAAIGMTPTGNEFTIRCNSDKTSCWVEAHPSEKGYVIATTGPSGFVIILCDMAKPKSSRCHSNTNKPSFASDPTLRNFAEAMGCTFKGQKASCPRQTGVPSGTVYEDGSVEP